MRALLGFLTTLPTGSMSIEDAARKSYLLPAIAVFIGLAVGSFSTLFFHYLPPALAALLTLLVLYLVTGINHVDGLADFADGIHAMGSKERKLKAMKDIQLGVAGVLALFFLLSFCLYGFNEIAGNIPIIIAAEVSAKTAMLTSIYLGVPRGEGLGSVFIRHLNRKAYPLSLLFSVIACFCLAPRGGLAALTAGILASILLVTAARRGFGCVTGDVMGAVNETSRVIALLVLVLLR